MSSTKEVFLFLMGCKGALHPYDESLRICSRKQGECLNVPDEFIPTGDM